MSDWDEMKVMGELANQERQQAEAQVHSCDHGSCRAEIERLKERLYDERKARIRRYRVTRAPARKLDAIIRGEVTMANVWSFDLRGHIAGVAAWVTPGGTQSRRSNELLEAFRAKTNGDLLLVPLNPGEDFAVWELI